MRAILLGVSIFGAATLPLAAEEPGRFTMTPTEKGFLRLDTATGTVSLCTDAEGGWACKIVPDDLAALQSEIDRLAQENAALRSELEALKSGKSDLDTKPGLPSEEELDQAFGFMEKLMKRFQDMIEQFRKDSEQGEGVPL
jgi:cell division protein FtsB